MKKTCLVLAILAVAVIAAHPAPAANLGVGNLGIMGQIDACELQCTVTQPNGIKIVDLACYQACKEKQESAKISLGIAIVKPVEIHPIVPGEVDPGFSQDDTDGDGLFDPMDNCVEDANEDQADWNEDGIGDVCQDSDSDGVMDDEDACKAEPEAVDLKSLLAIDGTARDGCPDSLEDEEKGSGNEEANPDFATGAGAGSGSCSIAGGAAANPLVFLLIGMALLPLARWRRK